MKLTGAVLVVAVACVCTGCESDAAHRYYSSERFEAVPQESVAILSEPPSRAHEVIADFQSRSGTAKEMQKRAAEIGADAVIVQLIGGLMNPNAEWTDEVSSKRFTRITGTAIRYRDRKGTK
jgi:hypothetical protein